MLPQFKEASGKASSKQWVPFCRLLKSYTTITSSRHVLLSHWARRDKLYVGSAACTVIDI